MITDFLCRLFVRRHEQTNDPLVRASYGTLSGVVGILLNLFLFTFKFFAGLITGSLAITADALNNLSDAGSSVISLVGFRIAAKPADREHPFGHARMEYIASIMVSFIILLIGAELLFSSVGKMFTPAPLVFHGAAVAVLCVSILCKLWLALFNSRLGKKIGSDVMRATATDSLMDALSTTAVLVAQIVFKLFDLNVDAYMGFAVSLLIVYAGIGILRDTKDRLLGEAPVSETVEGIRRIISQYPEALGIHDMLVHSYGAGHTFATLHVEVDGAKDVFETHDVIDLMERRIQEEMNIQCTIHLDPIVTDDERVSALRSTVAALAKEVDERLTIHDFRFVEGVTHTNLIFDLVVPFERQSEAEQLKCEVARRIKQEDEQFFAVIQTDYS